MAKEVCAAEDVLPGETVALTDGVSATIKSVDFTADSPFGQVKLTLVEGGTFVLPRDGRVTVLS